METQSHHRACAMFGDSLDLRAREGQILTQPHSQIPERSIRCLKALFAEKSEIPIKNIFGCEINFKL